jgi:hypothetical protein
MLVLFKETFNADQKTNEIFKTGMRAMDVHY